MLTQLTPHRVFKPWGRTDVSPAFGGESAAEPLGEIWFQRDGGQNDALLVKYLFTSQRLSVQVHPDDDAARNAGHPRGKDEAWLVLAAEPGAEIGIGLKKNLTTDELRASALDGSVAEKLDWRRVEPGDAFYSPAGTLHSIGAGLTLLEIQQNCDITYRLYDFGRPRELHLDDGVAAAKPDFEISKAVERPISDGRAVLAQGPKFTIERWSTSGTLQANREDPVWIVPLAGHASANGQSLEQPSVWLAEEPVSLELGEGDELLVAYESAGPAQC